MYVYIEKQKQEVVMSILLAILNSLLQYFGLVFAEVSSSADNFLVTAARAKDLEEEAAPPWPFNYPILGGAREAVMKAGLPGNFIMRSLLMFFGTVLLELPHAKLVAAGVMGIILAKQYILPIILSWFGIKMAFKSSNFWVTLIIIELLDIVMAMDNLALALGISHNLVILYAGNFTGVLLIRFSSYYALKLMERYPRLEHSAYLLIGLIGLQLVTAEVFSFVIPESINSIVPFIVFGAFICIEERAYRKRVKDIEKGIVSIEDHSGRYDGFYNKETGATFIQLRQQNGISFVRNTGISLDISKSMHSRAVRYWWKASSSIEYVLRTIGKEIIHHDDDHGVDIFACCAEDGEGYRWLQRYTETTINSLSISTKLPFGIGSNPLPGFKKAMDYILTPDSVQYGTLFYVGDGNWSDKTFESIIAWRDNLAKQMARGELVYGGKSKFFKLVILWSSRDKAILQWMRQLDNAPEILKEYGVDVIDTIQFDWNAPFKVLSQLFKEILLRTYNTTKGALKVVVDGQIVVDFKDEIPDCLELILPQNAQLLEIIQNDESSKFSLVG